MDLYAEFNKEKQAVREFLDKYWNIKVTPKKQIKTTTFEGNHLCKELQGEYSTATERVILAHGRDCDHVDVLIDVILVQGMNWGIQERKPDMKEKVEHVNSMAEHINSAGVLEERLSPVKVKYFPNNQKPQDYSIDMDSLVEIFTSYFTISAQPKGYRAHKRTANEFDFCDCGLDFNGREIADHNLVSNFLHVMCKHGVFYREERGDSSFHTLIRGVSGRGINLGVQFVYNSYQGYNKLRETINKVLEDPENRVKVFPPFSAKDKKKITKDLKGLIKDRMKK